MRKSESDSKYREEQVGSPFGWRCARSHMPVWAIYLQSGEYIIMGKHIGDTCTMCWEIYYVHPQSGHRLYLDTLRQPPAGSIWFAAAKIYGSMDAEHHCIKVMSRAVV